ncbi:MAG: 4Fe-4S binding protein [Thermodesulfobacteriota bacterium]
MKKIGVFVCHCGINIAGTVDVKKVARETGEAEDVVHSEDYIYMCSDPGQLLIRNAIREKGLGGVVVACCSPSMHEATFRKAVKSEGLNPYVCEIANIREQCSWVHQGDKEVATRKAGEIIRSVLEKLRQNEALETLAMPLTKRVLVIGGGIAGITASVDLADGGYEVILVEQQPSVGGRLGQLSQTFPHLDDARCILGPKKAEVASHPKIKVMRYCEVDEVKGFIGNFDVRIRRKPRYVDWEKCTTCGACLERCPVETPSEFERGLKVRKAIYTGAPPGDSGKPVIDLSHCRHMSDGTCTICQEACPEGAIQYDQRERLLEERVGAIVIATGYDLFPMERIGEYGYGRIPDVIDGLAFERMLSPSGATGGEIRRPSDGRIPQEVVFIQCVASRDPERYMPYCSRVCCMYTAKQAKLLKQKVPGVQPYVFFMDIRTDSKGYEEFLQGAIEEGELIYLRGRVARVFREGDKVKVWGEDTLTNRRVELAADLVVLATALVPSPGIKDVAAKVRATTDKHGFLTEAHIKLYPVESSTKGIFLAGCGQGPKDITDTVAQASATASKIQSIFSQDVLLQDPLVAFVDPEICSGCGICVHVCPYEAREMDEYRKISRVHEALCQGCGACIAACPNNACELRNSRAMQVFGVMDVFAGGRERSLADG